MKEPLEPRALRVFGIFCAGEPGKVVCAIMGAELPCPKVHSAVGDVEQPWVGIKVGYGSRRVWPRHLECVLDRPCTQRFPGPVSPLPASLLALASTSLALDVPCRLLCKGDVLVSSILTPHPTIKCKPTASLWHK